MDVRGDGVADEFKRRSASRGARGDWGPDSFAPLELAHAKLDRALPAAFAAVDPAAPGLDALLA
jgi:hypothetical protein